MLAKDASILSFLFVIGWYVFEEAPFFLVSPAVLDVLVVVLLQELLVEQGYLFVR